jgi:hypothetical protein
MGWDASPLPVHVDQVGVAADAVATGDRAVADAPGAAAAAVATTTARGASTFAAPSGAICSDDLRSEGDLGTYRGETSFESYEDDAEEEEEEEDPDEEPDEDSDADE